MVNCAICAGVMVAITLVLRPCNCALGIACSALLVSEENALEVRVANALEVNPCVCFEVRAAKSALLKVAPWLVILFMRALNWPEDNAVI